MLKHITSREVVEKLKLEIDIILLDVRTPQEYEQVRIKNALLLPVQLLSQETLEDIGLGENAKHKEIIVYCQSGGRSLTAYSFMQRLGYTNIKNLTGGIVRWSNREFVEK